MRDIVDSYLDALGLSRENVSREYLDAIVRRHVEVLSFTSVGPRLGEDLPLDLPSVHDRIVVRRRGGYCFEQNGLLHAALLDLGFDSRIVLARVIMGRSHLPGLTHRICLVTLDGEPLVVDGGFGAYGPPRAVPLIGGESGASHRIVEAAPGVYHQQARVSDEFVSLYRFDLGDYGDSDCEIGHFYSHRHPAANFVNHLVASRILEGEVRSLRNREYQVIRPGGVEVTAVRDGEHLRSLLRDELGVEVSDDEAQRLFRDARVD
jgi:N-hydroxyarylamine O-acetyltransferase